MTRNRRLSWVRGMLPLGSILLLLISGPRAVLTATPPVAAAATETGSPVDSIAAPPVSPLLPPPEPIEPFVPTTSSATLSSPLPGDRGSMATIGGLGLPAAEPTAAERVKLEMARAAIEKALPGAISPAAACGDEPIVPAPPEIEAAKLERLRTTRPAVLLPDRAAGVGEDPPPLQESGPAAMNPQEMAKLAATKDAARADSVLRLVVLRAPGAPKVEGR